MAAVRQHFVCKCAFERNIFLKKLKLHVTFQNKDQFLNDYQQELSRKGIKEKQLEQLIAEIYEEIERRKASGSESLKRKQFILEKYKHIHPHLLTLKEEYLANEFLQLFALARNKETSKEILINSMKKEKAPLSYSFKVFKDAFSDQFLEEIENFTRSGLPMGKPNTMNNFGVLLSEIGFKENLLDPLVLKYLNPIAKILYPDWVGEGLDSHRSFIVGYQIGKDVDLSYHYDDAEVTLNVSLGKAYEGGELYIAGMKDEFNWSKTCYKYEHKKSFGFLHRGQQMHGAIEIDDGERYNLVIWMRSSSVRNKCCPMCSRPPDLVEVEGDGAGFTMKQVDMCCTL